MKVLHILTDGPTKLSTRIIKAQSADSDIKVIDLSNRKESYGEIVDDIFSYDKVISW